MKKEIVILILAICSSCTQYGQLTYRAELPGKLDEVSGIIAFDPGRVWVIEDSSNPDALRELDTLGERTASFKVKDAKNRDWEALTRDASGHVYIGDFGNNSNDRKNLRIYKLPDPRVEKGDKIPSDKIRFFYPDQLAFPPEAADFRFDAEALFHWQGHLYIITKNRSKPFDGTAKVYRIPDQPGTYAAEAVTTIETCPRQRACQITDAALSPTGNRLVLLGYRYLWVFENFKENGFSGAPPKRIDLQNNTQLEAVCFATETLLYLADERSHGVGGHLYSYDLPLP